VNRNSQKKTIRSVDLEKAENDALFDGISA
jgi:hypothetical protein